ncbi:lipase family protein [Streptococcus ferus]|uniref:lipase family protein n=1 Tax=Streptococcus ferus TaxID=1345 RepID=UPI00235414BC|nr:hypothetical protein [Streptococcus ferus]
MITESSYNGLANSAYNVQPSKAKSNGEETVVKNTVITDETTGQSFQVLKVEDNTANGMQAMAVAPVDKAGNVDTRQVVIAYAGTNSTDVLDLLTDVQQVGLGQSSLIIPNAAAGLTEELDTQVETALSFAKAVEKAYPRATITTTGHSLGGSLSMYVSLKQGYASTTYNGPDISQMISDKEIKYMQEHREQFRNYRNPHDIIGNITGNKTKSAIYPDTP